MAGLRGPILAIVCFSLAAWGSLPAPIASGVTTLAGSGKIGPLGGGYADGPAAEAQFHDPMGLALDTTGNLYVSDWVNHRIRRITPDGRVTTVAGCGEPGARGGLVDSPAAIARFFGPEGLAVDAAGNSSSPIPSTTVSAALARMGW